VEELTRTSVLGQQAWVEARAKDDYATFRPLLEKTILLKREEADAIGFDETPYDALLDDYEPREQTANVARVLAGLRDELVPLVAQIQQSKRSANLKVVSGTFPVEAQEAFGTAAAT